MWRQPGHLLSRSAHPHGIAGFPDPFENSHQIGFRLDGTGIDQNSPRFTAAQKACQPLMPGGGP
jgi:hypothetical protein